MANLAVSYDVIPRRPVRWLHEKFVPIGHVTMVIGPGGTSKGISALDYVARITRNDPMPGASESVFSYPGDGLVVLPEDDPNEAVAGRLIGGGAVSDRVHNLTVLPGGQHFTVPQHIALIPLAIEQVEYEHDEHGKLVCQDGKKVRRYAKDGKPRKVRIVVLDPLLALAENDLRTRGQARPVMEELEDLAKRMRLVILLTHHVNADGRAASSRALVETCRNVLSISVPDGEPNARLLTVAKTNIGKTGEQTGYRLAGTLEEPHIEWDADQPAADAPDDRGYAVAAQPQVAELIGQAQDLIDQAQALVAVPDPIPHAGGIPDGVSVGKHAAAWPGPPVLADNRKWARPA